jgi:hypothetical protein
MVLLPVNQSLYARSRCKRTHFYYVYCTLGVSVSGRSLLRLLYARGLCKRALFVTPVSYKQNKCVRLWNKGASQDEVEEINT